MPGQVISTPEAPEYPSYGQAVKVGNTIDQGRASTAGGLASIKCGCAA